MSPQQAEADRSAWRALGVFWLCVVVALGGVGVVLHRLGAPEQAASLEASAEPERPPEASARTADVPAEPAPSPPPAPQPAPPTTLAAPAPPPAAPEAPPLPEPADRASAGVARPIPPPDPALQEPGRFGPLPRIAPDGRTSIRAYGRGFDRTDSRPRVAILIGGIGLSASLSDDAVRRLPPAASLAVSPYATRPEALVERARARGMELLLALPMEPMGFPQNDPGDRALLTGLSAGENLDRLDWALSRLGGFVGVVGAHGAMRGERFAAVPELLNAVQDTLRSRGLLYIEPRPGAAHPGRAWGRAVDLLLDEPATRGEIERRLAELERLARERGSALGLAADPTPVLVDRIVAWAGGLESRGVVLVPVSALIRRPEGVPTAAAR